LALSIAFLLGLALLFLGRDPWAVVPGSASVGDAALAALAIPVPWSLTVLARRQLRRRLLRGERTGLSPRRLARASSAASPLTLLLVLVPGGWFDLSWQWSGDSHLASMALLLAPLLAIELPRLVASTAVGALCELADELRGQVMAPQMLPDLRDLWPAARLRLGWPLLLLMPWTLLGVALDLLQLDRELYVFFVGTSVGVTVGSLLFLAVAAAALPPWFRFAFGAVARWPEPVGSMLRGVAASFGFRPANVLYLPTGMRALNAMMVGPLPLSRCLVVTDGLVRALDDASLAGVVAHEVGHARMGHPGLLMAFAVVVPFLLLGPLQLLDVGDTDPMWQAVGALLVMALLWSLVRGLAHRFEHEADIASVQLLGSGPCTRALLCVSRLAQPVSHGIAARAFSLHPDEQTRFDVMRRYETEPSFRVRFDAASRRLRIAVVGLLVAAMAAAGATWLVEWPRERAIWRFWCGDVAAARALGEGVTEPPPDRWREPWARFREELAAAAEIAPTAASWAEAQPAFLGPAWRRGIATLLAAGPAAARPWFVLAEAAAPSGSVLHRCLREYCQAARDGDVGRMDALRAVLRRTGYPAELAQVFQ
jgi:Zn-dependent protease with chaperone function